MSKRILITLVIFSFLIGIGFCQDTTLIKKAKRIHNEAITVDTHVDIAGAKYATKELDPGIDHPSLRCDLVKMKRGGMDGVFLAAFIGQRNDFSKEAYQKVYLKTIEQFKAIHRLFKQYPDRCEPAKTASDLIRIEKSGKRAIMIGIENGYPVGDSLKHLPEFYKYGTRYITICHSRHNQLCDSSSPKEPKHNGLSDLGKRVISEMNKLGIMCDVSHISEKSFWDLIKVTKAPIIASHSGCYDVNAHNRNLNDKQLKALAKNGGVIQIVALGGFLKTETEEHKNAVKELRDKLKLPNKWAIYRMSKEERKAIQPQLEKFKNGVKEIEKTHPGTSIKEYIDHIDHAVKVAGIDHVGVGTDFDGGGGITGFNNHGEALNVTIELLKRGYTEKQIKKIWGQNLIRVWKEVERVSQKLQSK